MNLALLEIDLIPREQVSLFAPPVRPRGTEREPGIAEAPCFAVRGQRSRVAIPG